MNDTLLKKILQVRPITIVRKETSHDLIDSICRIGLKLYSNRDNASIEQILGTWHTYQFQTTQCFKDCINSEYFKRLQEKENK